MKIRHFFAGSVLITTLLALTNDTESNRYGPDSGLTQIIWVGFDNQPLTSPVPANVTNLTMPGAISPKKVENKLFFYEDRVMLNNQFFVKTPPMNPTLKSDWFLRRRVLKIQNGQTQVLGQPTKLIPNKAASAAISPTLQGISFEATHVEYQLGRTEKIIVPGGPNGLPKTKTIEVFPLKAVRVAVLVADILKKTCPVPNDVRPIPCEFETVKLQILGKSGKVLHEITPGNAALFIKVPENEAKQILGPTRVYGGKWIVRRINPPNYKSQKGYLVTFGKSGADFINEVDNNGALLTGLPMTGNVGTETTLALDVKASSSGITYRVLCLENDVTKTKFTGQVPASYRADAHIKLNW